MLEVFSTRGVLKHRHADRLSFVMVVWRRFIRRPIGQKDSTRRRNSIEMMLGHTHRVPGNRLCMIELITARAWVFSHLLHLFDVREPLLGGVESEAWVLFLETEILRILSHSSRASFLECESKVWARGSIETVWARLVVLISILIAIGPAILVSCWCESLGGWAEYSSLVLVRLSLVMLNSLKEGASPHFYILVFHWDHLVKIDGLPFRNVGRLLILKSDLARSEWLEVVPRTQLVVKNFQFVLNLSVILARARICFLLFGNLVHEISLDRGVEWIGHDIIRDSKTGANLLKNALLLFLGHLVDVVLVWRGRLGVSWIAIRHDGNISLDQTVPFCLRAKCAKVSALSFRLIFHFLFWIVLRRTWSRLELLGWAQWVSGNLWLENHITLVNCEWSDLV